MKLFFRGVGSLFVGVFCLSVPQFAAAVEPNGTVSQFQVTQSTSVPNKTLKPGSYSISVVDHLSDRMVLRVVNSNGKEETTFLAVPATATFSTDGSAGPVDMKSGPGAKSALRGFKFSDGTTAEFVYPKAEAVSLAKANSTTIPAIDPASEGKPDAPKLSRSDMELVTLWTLTPTQVGPDHQAGIEANRYRATDASAAPAPPPTPVAVPAAAPGPNVVAKEVTPPRPGTVRAGTVRTTGSMKALPHTASSLPSIELAGFLALCGAALLGMRRFAFSR